MSGQLDVDPMRRTIRESLDHLGIFVESVLTERDGLRREIDRLRADRHQRDREQRAAALREAADWVVGMEAIEDLPRWLNERADRIEAQDA